MPLTRTVVFALAALAFACSPVDGGGGRGVGDAGAVHHDADVVGQPCELPTECGEPSACAAPLCADGLCARFDAPERTQVEAQIPRDCKRAECDGAGNAREVADDTDLEDDGDACTVDACADGQPTHLPAEAGALCEAGVCDGAGACVECLDGADCQSGLCTERRTCVPGVAPSGPSCSEEPMCAGRSCCHSLVVFGAFPMGRSPAGADAHTGNDRDTGFASEQPEHDVTIGPFYLDTYEVTVARFRRFVEGYDAWRAAGGPAAGAGAHPRIARSGWRGEWAQALPESRDALEGMLVGCDRSRASWTAEPAGNEARALNCVSWPVAFAFCAWDGGRLPTEAEWELAAAGGDENRKYPWGDAPPNQGLANVAGRAPMDVGATPQGAGRYGHEDLTGNVEEWCIDYYDGAWFENDGAVCRDCANVDDAGSTGTRVQKGGGWWNSNPEYTGRNARRGNADPAHNDNKAGMRCARDMSPVE